MTRVNVGIRVVELCNEHLMAEYRELPRCFRRFERAAPKHFCLGTGHMAWCAQYQGSLKRRLAKLRAELIYRGYKLTDYKAHEIHPLDAYWTEEDEAFARPVMIRRLSQRLREMKHVHYYRSRPSWAPEKQ